MLKVLGYIMCKRIHKKFKGNQNDIKIFSKLETIVGLNNYKEIMNCSDGIVIARGDLVPECGWSFCGRGI